VTTEPIVVAVPLDDTTAEVVSAACVLARRLEAPLLPVHAIAPYPFPTARHTAADAQTARDAVRAAFANDTERVTVEEASVGESAATPWILEVALRAHAQLIVVGAGHGATVGSWLLGTVADRVVRAARCPVFVVRGPLPGPSRPIVCPVDLTPHSHLGLEAALRMARLLEAPLEVLTVLPRAAGTDLASLEAEASRLERATHEELEALLRAHDVRDVAVTVHVVAGEPAAEIVEAGKRAQLVVLASRTFDMLVPASVGDVASRVLRNTRCSVLAVRDLDDDVGARAALVARVVGLRDEARKALDEAEIDRAVRLLGIARSLLPGHAVLEDDLATAYDRAGKPEEAARHRDAARILRVFHS